MKPVLLVLWSVVASLCALVGFSVGRLTTATVPFAPVVVNDAAALVPVITLERSGPTTITASVAHAEARFLVQGKIQVVPASGSLRLTVP
jgi:hypothetical protein